MALTDDDKQKTVNNKNGQTNTGTAGGQNDVDEDYTLDMAPYLTGSVNFESFSKNLVDQAYEKGLLKEEYMNSVMAPRRPQKEAPQVKDAGTRTGSTASAGTQIRAGSVPVSTQARSESVPSEKSLPSGVKLTPSEDISQVYNTYRQNAEESEVYLPEIKFKKFSAKEAARREELSVRAHEAIFSLQYDRLQIFNNLRIAGDSGEVSKDLVEKFIGSNRDFPLFIMNYITENRNVKINLDRFKYFHAIGIDPKRPDYEDVRKKMAAEVINEAMLEMTDFPYGDYENLSDEQIVEQYPRYAEAYFKASIAEGALAYINQHYGDNPYINKDLLAKCDEIRIRYSGCDYENTQRIRYMANPYYSKQSMAQYDSNMKSLDNSMLQPNASEVDDMVARQYLLTYSLALSAKRDNFKNRMSCALHDLNLKDNKLNIGFKNIEFFDADGNTLDDDAIFDEARAGHILYCASTDFPDAERMAYRMNKQGMPEAVPDVMRRTRRRENAAREKIAERVKSVYEEKVAEEKAERERAQKEAYEKNHVMALENGYSNTKFSFTENIVTIISEAAKKKISPERVRGEMLAHYSSDPAISKEDFFKVTGLAGDGPLPSDEEIIARREITMRAHSAVFDFGLRRFQSGSTSNKQAEIYQDFNIRIFDSVMRITDPDNPRANEEMEKEFFSGDPARQAAVIEKVFRHYLSKEKLFAGPISDEDLINNWAELNEMTVAVGMEYEGFKKGFIESHNIPVDPQLLKAMDRLNAKVMPFHGSNNVRMEYICSRYYQYKPEMSEQVLDGLTKLEKTTKDPEIRKTRAFLSSNLYGLADACGSYALDSIFPGGRGEIEYFVDGKGNIHKTTESLECGQSMQAGETLLFVHKGDNQVKSIRFDTSIFPPAAHEYAVDVTRDEVNTAYYEIKRTELAKKSISSEETLFQLNELNAREALDKLVSAGPGSPDFEKLYKERVTDLLTRIALHKLYNNDKISSDRKNRFLSEDGFKKYRDQMARTGIADRFVKEYPAKDSSLAKIDDDKIYLDVQDIQKEIEKDRLKAKAKSDNLLSPDRIKNLRQTKISAVRMTQADYFGISVAVKEQTKAITKLERMSISRTALPTLAACILLDKGATPDQIYAPENANARQMAGELAVKAVQENNYKYIRSMYLSGGNKMADYAGKKLDSMKEVSISEMAKPENKLLMTLDAVMQDCAQEIDACQDHPSIKKSMKLDSKLVDKLVSRLNSLSIPINKISNGIIIQNKCTPDNVSSSITNYVTSKCLTEYINQQRSSGENKGKHFEEIFNMEKAASIGMLQGAVSSKVLKTNARNFDDMAVALTYTCLEDDTFKDGLDVKIGINKETGYPDVDFNLKEAFTRISYRQSLPLEKLAVAGPKAPAPRKISAPENKTGALAK